jgi:hypothetical protein
MFVNGAPSTAISTQTRGKSFLPLISAELMAFLATFAALPDGALPSCLELPWRS